MNTPLFDPSVDKLATLLEEGARASKRSVQRFIEPMQGTLRRARSKRHHLIFGRRGSGKSSLLYKSANTLSKDGTPVAYVDLESYKGHHYPDVLISVLLATFTDIQNRASNANNEPRNWKYLWLKRKANPSKKIEVSLLKTAIDDLTNQLHMADNSDLITKVESQKHEAKTGEMVSKGKVSSTPLSGEIESKIANERKHSDINVITENYKRSKIDYLNRKILDFRKIFTLLSESTTCDSYLFLDDLYHLTRSDQAVLLDYFHRIAKGCSLWLKSGTIRHRSTWYIHSPQPMGLKIGDDADDIDLDLTLEKFASTKKFLSQVLESYIEEAKAPSSRKIISEGAIDRLVIASGGVTRDFLQIFRRSIDEAKERLSNKPNHARGELISAEDVNVASGSYGQTKQQEFQKDTREDEIELVDAFEKIRMFCLEINASNIFLIDQDISNNNTELVEELVDLRLVHHVRSRVTVSSKPGQVFRALLLDVSQYTGERKRRNFQMVEFWKGNRELLRKASWIYDPSITKIELQNRIEHKKPSSSQTNTDGDSLFDI